MGGGLGGGGPLLAAPVSETLNAYAYAYAYAHAYACAPVCPGLLGSRLPPGQERCGLFCLSRGRLLEGNAFEVERQSGQAPPWRRCYFFYGRGLDGTCWTQ